MRISELYVVRHGIAEHENPDHPGQDHFRRLAPEGVVQLKQVAIGLAAFGVQPDCILASPHMRADATARLLAERLTPSTPPITISQLAMGATSSALLDHLETVEATRVMVVGHNPMLSEFVSDLTAGGRLRIGLGRASLTWLRVRDGILGPSGELKAYVPAPMSALLGAG